MNPFGSFGDDGRRPEAFGPYDRTRYSSGQFGGYGGGQYGSGQYGSGHYGCGYDGSQYDGGYGSGQYGGGYSGGQNRSGQNDGGYGGQSGGYGSGRSYGPFGSNQYGPSGNISYGRGGYGDYYDGDRFDRGNSFYQRNTYPSGSDRYPRDQYRGEFRRGSIPDVQFDRERRDASGGRRDFDRRDDRYGQDRFMSSRRPGDESYPREALYRTNAESNVNRRFEPLNQERSQSRSNFRGSVDPEDRRSEAPGAGPVVRIAAREGSPFTEPRPK